MSTALLLVCSECRTESCADGILMCEDAHSASLVKVDRLSMWTCADCGWTWPLRDAQYQDPECDRCGGEMYPAADHADR